MLTEVGVTQGQSLLVGMEMLEMLAKSLLVIAIAIACVGVLGLFNSIARCERGRPDGESRAVVSVVGIVLVIGGSLAALAVAKAPVTAAATLLVVMVALLAVCAGLRGWRRLGAAAEEESE